MKRGNGMRKSSQNEQVITVQLCPRWSWWSWWSWWPWRSWWSWWSRSQLLGQGAYKSTKMWVSSPWYIEIVRYPGSIFETLTVSIITTPGQGSVAESEEKTAALLFSRITPARMDEHVPIHYVRFQWFCIPFHQYVRLQKFNIFTNYKYIVVVKPGTSGLLCWETGVWGRPP